MAGAWGFLPLAALALSLGQWQNILSGWQAATYLMVTGAVWAFQGAGYIPGSFMSNDPTWIYIGGGTVVVGLILAFLGIRSKPAAKTQP